MAIISSKTSKTPENADDPGKQATAETKVDRTLQLMSIALVPCDKPRIPVSRREFHLFMLLPPEIRFNIWELVLPPKRTIYIWTCPTRLNTSYRWNIGGSCRLDHGPAASRKRQECSQVGGQHISHRAPTALRACHDSRKWALKYHYMSIPQTNGNSIYIDWKRDNVIVQDT